MKDVYLVRAVLQIIFDLNDMFVILIQLQQLLCVDYLLLCRIDKLFGRKMHVWLGCELWLFCRKLDGKILLPEMLSGL
jgi:hypothetical protein